MFQEDIFKGATRPPMLAGVPLVPLLMMVCATLLLVFWGGLLISKWLAILAIFVSVPCYIWMRMVSKKDDQRLAQMMIRLKLALPQKNKRFWKARSYAPVQWLGGKDVFRK